MGILTRGVVRIRPRPGFEAFYGVFFRDWEAGMQAMRRLAQEAAPVSMARLSNAYETETTLALSGKEALVRLANRGLRLAGYGERPCLMILKPDTRSMRSIPCGSRTRNPRGTCLRHGN